MVRKVQWGNLRARGCVSACEGAAFAISELSGYPSKQDREEQLTYGDRKKQDWYFTSKAVVAMANIALTAPSVCCLGLE